MSTNSVQRRRLETIDRALAWVIAAGATIIGALTFWAHGSRIVELASSASVRVEGMQLGNSVSPAFLSAAPSIRESSYESVRMTVDGLPAVARGWFIAESAAAGIATVGICAVLVWLSVRVAQRRPFESVVTWGVAGAAILTMVGGTLTQVFGSAARASVVEFLGAGLTAGDSGAGPREGFTGFALSLDLAPIGWGIALAVVATAFQFGQRLQRDTEGLV